ncbi:DNA translocase FtsK [Macrococcus capreoli]|uniref:DNA translocase FtsK n=1 Tax=Macrococcus capreoli TaxID=2982690 RepID=UPI003EE58812
MSWFDKLFGESSDKETKPIQESVNEDDVYRRPRGKFRFPLNVDNIKTAEHHISQHDQTDADRYQKQSYTKASHETVTYQPDNVNTETIRTSFGNDYIPRRERRRGKQSNALSESKYQSHNQASPNFERYQPKTRLNDTPHYSRYQPKASYKEASFTEKQFNVHQPKFKASEVPSAIYGTKPRKDPATLKQPVKSTQPIQPIQGKKVTQTRPATPPHRKEDNTVNIENVYASQIVAEIRREREKKLQRKKQFELEREQIKLQQEAISSMMHEDKNDVEYLKVEDQPQILEDRVTIIDTSTADHTPQLKQVDVMHEAESKSEYVTANEHQLLQESDARVETIQIDDGDAVTYSTKTPLHGNDNDALNQNSQDVEIEEVVPDEDVEIIEIEAEIESDAEQVLDDETVNITEDETEMDSLKSEQSNIEVINVDEVNSVDEVIDEGSFLDENVTFEPIEEESETEVVDDTFEASYDEAYDESLEVDDTSQSFTESQTTEVQPGKSLEPTLMPDIQPATPVQTPSIIEEDANKVQPSLEPELAINSTEEPLDEPSNEPSIEDSPVETPEHLTINNDLPKKKVSPFNVVMTPSDKRRLLEKKKQQNIEAPTEKNESIAQDIQQSFEQGVINQEVNKAPEAVSEITQKPTQEVIYEKSSQPAQQNRPIVSTNGYPVKKEPAKRIGPKYLLPPVSLLHPEDKMERDETWVAEHQAQLDDAFYHFNVPAKVENVVVGPSVTRFELSVEKGVKVSRITNLQDDIKMALAAKDIRIEAPIPGTSLVGVEVPNVETRNVNLSEVLFSKKMKFAESKLTVALGARINNEPMIMDLAKMPHGLIAGATGSGKSVCINSILVSLLYRNNPNELKLLLIDPKMVELAPYNDLPHLIAPVITDVKAATESLKWVVEEMERRYKIFAHIHVRNITAYNQKVSYVERLPKIVIVIDELADLMMMSPQDVEHAIARIAQKARAAGIHMILATQRPSVNVITGLIKANVPTRIAFMVSSAVDSRTIIDSGGAEKLLGNGDMLYLGNGMNKPIRIQGNYVSDEEIDAVVQYVKTQGEPNYLFQEQELLKKVSEAPKDELFNEICDFMIDEGHISTSQIQRRFQIGYNRAARIIDQLEEMGYVSGQNGSKPRAVLITEKQAEY